MFCEVSLIIDFQESTQIQCTKKKTQGNIKLSVQYLDDLTSSKIRLMK